MITTSVIVLIALGFTAAAVLAAASKALYVKEDPRIAQVEACLPGANCGGCGLPGCGAAAAAVVAGKAKPDLCVAGGNEIAEAIAKVMGMSVDFSEPEVAELICTGGNRAETIYAYEGIHDCRAEAMLYYGEKSCGLGCIGMGTCVRACPFDALQLDEQNLPVVNKTLCRSCGKCTEVCPTGAIRISGLSANLLHINKTQDCLAPCMQKCPIQVDVRTFVHQLKKGRLASALQTVKSRNPLPLILGRVCPAPCEQICRRNILDSGVAISTLQKFVAEWEMQSGQHVPLDCNPDTGHRVAIVGAGPAGLSCAYFLRRLGHHPVLFDTHAEPGGMLRYAIPEFRLPHHVVEWEIHGILEIGVEYRPFMNFGKDFTLESLAEDGFESVFLATGAWHTPSLDIPGGDGRNVMGSVQFLGEIGVHISSMHEKTVVVVGGTNAAMDTARTVIRLGASRVVVLAEDIQRKMSANKTDIKHATSAGAEIMEQTRPVEFHQDGHGNVVRVDFEQVQYKDEKKASGPILSVPDTLQSVDCDLVVVCLERWPELECFKDAEGNIPFKVSKQGTVEADKATMQTSLPHVFAGGELRLGRSLVMDAVADGRRAARSIHTLLTEGKVRRFSAPPLERVIPESILKGMKVTYSIPRVKEQEIPVDVRKHSMTKEVTLPITLCDAVKEASRCLHCGLTCYDSDAGSEYANDPDVLTFEEIAAQKAAKEAAEAKSAASAKDTAKEACA
ncbi:MAG: RnfABCDGE type electron transport complex subunit B [Desulfovibrio sp.]|uniref:RnfABCDGE type electron transport complex subunit B n=1 Tax=Desulfovibrio sp. 7SRBS1 TaxID=3378064 RepID=UPI003B3D2C68